MNKDTVSLTIEKIIGGNTAMGYLHIYRQLDSSEQEIAVDIEYDIQPFEKMTHDYPGCDASCEITSVADSATGDIEFDLDCIDNLLEAGESVLNFEVHPDE